MAPEGAIQKFQAFFPMILITKITCSMIVHKFITVSRSFVQTIPNYQASHSLRTATVFSLVILLFPPHSDVIVIIYYHSHAVM